MIPAAVGVHVVAAKPAAVGFLIGISCTEVPAVADVSDIGSIPDVSVPLSSFASDDFHAMDSSTPRIL